MAICDFSIGGLYGWHAVLLGLGASLVFLIGGWQDVGHRTGFSMMSSAFWFILALASIGSVIWLGIGSRMWAGILLGVAALCSEAWLIRRWWRRGRST